VRANTIALSVCLLALPGLGWAEDLTAPAVITTPPEVVATAAGAPGAPGPATQSGDPQLTRWLSQAPSVSLGAGYQDGAIQQLPDKGVHGVVGVGFGTGGYRDAYVAATMPVGKTGELGVAIEDTQLSKPFKIDQRRLAVNLALGGASNAPADCAEAIRVGDHYVEPLWVTRIRGSALQDVDPRCVSALVPPR
jgi:hypothetical protein